VIAENQSTRLSHEGPLALAQALLNPPGSNARFKRGANAYRRRTGTQLR